MATLTLKEAAERAGISKTSMFRAIKAGRLSAGRADGGTFQIDASELHRAFPDRPVKVTKSAPQEREPARAAEQSGMGAEFVELRIRNAELAAQLSATKELLEEMRRARDDWKGQAQQLALPKPVAPAPAWSWWPFRRP